MKIRSSIAVALACLIGGASSAADMAGMKMDKPADTATKTETHHAVGVVKAVDAALGTITLSHEPVASIKWPAMTMPFKAGKEQIAAVKPGDRVNFEFVAQGMNATLTAITKVK
jgi:Cu(I)/Ag(I) efflux system protein CusF